MKNLIPAIIKAITDAAKLVIILAVLGLGVLLWALLPDSQPANNIDPPQPPTPTLNTTTTTTTAVPTTTTAELTDVEHCGCEGACDKCHHLCLECKCGSHIIDRGIKCQEFAACESGCSGDDDDVTGEEPGIKPCKHCHKVCDDAHGGDANPACQACIAEHCILGCDSVPTTTTTPLVGSNGGLDVTPPDNIVKAWQLAKEAKETAHVHKAHNPHNKTDCNNEYHSAQGKMDQARALLGSDILNLPTTDKHGETVATEFDEWDRDWGKWGTYCDARHANWADTHAFHIVQTLSTACHEC